MLLALAFVALTPLADQAAGPRVDAIRATQAGDEVVIRLLLSGPATPSEPVLLEHPWRLYVDLPGVLPGSRKAVDVRTGGVTQVRVALNQTAPPVTRVVIDLSSKAAWRSERSGDGRELRLIVGGDGTTAAKPAAAPQGPRGAVLYAPAAPAAPRDRREQIRADVFAMRGAIEAIRAWTGPSDADLAAMIASLEQLATGARAMQISGSASDRALLSAIDAAGAAARARAAALADGTPQSRDNAIAAAAGALLLLERARSLESKP